jgi:hypothetical protein
VDYIDASDAIDLAPGQHITGIRLQLQAAGLAVTGTVRKPNGEAVANYMIEVEAIGENEVFEPYTTTMTDENGAFQVQNVPEGMYRLYPTQTNRGRWRAEAQAGESVEIVLPEPNSLEGDLPLSPGGVERSE